MNPGSNPAALICSTCCKYAANAANINPADSTPAAKDEPYHIRGRRRRSNWAAAGTGTPVTTLSQRRSGPGGCSPSSGYCPPRRAPEPLSISGTPSLPQRLIESGIETIITEDAQLRRIPGITVANPYR